jgi:hypothetical protein
MGISRRLVLERGIVGGFCHDFTNEQYSGWQYIAESMVAFGRFAMAGNGSRRDLTLVFGSRN